MNDGLAILGGWIQWVLIVALLCFAVLRHVAASRDEDSTLYERDPRPEP